MGILMLLRRGIQHIGVRKLQMTEGWWLCLRVHSCSGLAGASESPSELNLWIVPPSSPQSMTRPFLNLDLVCSPVLLNPAGHPDVKECSQGSSEPSEENWHN